MQKGKRGVSERKIHNLWNFFLEIFSCAEKKKNYSQHMKKNSKGCGFFLSENPLFPKVKIFFRKTFGIFL
jgi:hypothetical protein